MSVVATELSIGELTERTGVATSALRYYEAEASSPLPDPTEDSDVIRATPSGGCRA